MIPTKKKLQHWQLNVKQELETRQTFRNVLPTTRCLGYEMSLLTRTSTSLFTSLVVSGFVVSVVRHNSGGAHLSQQQKRQDLRNKK